MEQQKFERVSQNVLKLSSPLRDFNDSAYLIQPFYEYLRVFQSRNSDFMQRVKNQLAFIQLLETAGDGYSFGDLSFDDSKDSQFIKSIFEILKYQNDYESLKGKFESFLGRRPHENFSNSLKKIIFSYFLLTFQQLFQRKYTRRRYLTSRDLETSPTVEDLYRKYPESEGSWVFLQRDCSYMRVTGGGTEGLDIPLEYFEYLLEQQRIKLEQHSAQESATSKITQAIIKQFLSFEFRVSLDHMEFYLLKLASQETKRRLLPLYSEIVNSGDEKWSKVKVHLFYNVFLLRNGQYLDDSFDEILLSQFRYLKRSFLVRSFQPFLHKDNIQQVRLFNPQLYRKLFAYF